MTAISFLVKETAKVNQKVLRDWIRRNSPLGIERLSVAASVSSSTIRNMLNGRAPKNRLFRRSIAQAIGLPEVIVFPADDKKSA